MSSGKSHHQRSSRRESKRLPQVFHDANADESKPFEQTQEVIGYMADFIDPKVVLKKRTRIVNESDVMHDGSRQKRAVVEEFVYGSQVFFFCLQHKPKAGVGGCRSLMELEADMNLFTNIEPVCRAPGCDKALLPMRNLFLTFQVYQMQDSGISCELKGDLLTAVDQVDRNDNKSGGLEKCDSALDFHTKSFGWSNQFELVQFLFDWKAELRSDGRSQSKIIAKSFRQSRVGLKSFSVVFLVRLSDKPRGNGTSDRPKPELEESDLVDLGCRFDESLQSYARKFSSIADLNRFLRKFGGTLHVEIANKGQKQPVLPIITLSGGNRLQQFIEKSQVS